MTFTYLLLGTKYRIQEDYEPQGLESGFLFFDNRRFRIELLRGYVPKNKKDLWENGKLTCGILVLKNIPFFLFKLEQDIHCFPMNIYTDDSLYMEEWIKTGMSKTQFSIVIYNLAHNEVLALRNIVIEDSKLVHSAVVNFKNFFSTYFQAEAVINEIMKTTRVKYMYKMASKIYPLPASKYIKV